MALYSSLTREQSDELAGLLGYRVLDPNDPRIEDNWVVGVDYPTLKNLRELDLMPSEIGLSIASSALEDYIRAHGVPTDTRILERLLYKNREE